VAQARVISRQQQQLFSSARALKAADARNQASAQAELHKISKQVAEATAIASSTQAEISNLQPQQQAAVQQSTQQIAPVSKTAKPQAAAPAPAPAPSVGAGASITLKLGPSNPNRFGFGYCTWYVAQIYSIPWLGNANQWPAAAAAAGQAEGQTPVVGAIMESADSSLGHVSVVTAVTDNNHWTVTEMNYTGWDVVDTRQVTRATSNLVTFIY